MSDNALINIGTNAVQTYDDTMFDAIKSGADFLPRLQLMTANSAPCKAGEFPTNHYARVADNEFRDLGDTVDVIVCSWRPMALEQDDEDGVIVVYDPKADDTGKPTGEFARIQKKADSAGMNGCMYGPQFLVWVPSANEFMTFYMASKTARRAAPAVKARMYKAATLGSRKIETKDYTWFGPTCQACSTPLETPDEASLMEEINKFTNPPEPAVETVEEDESGRER